MQKNRFPSSADSRNELQWPSAPEAEPCADERLSLSATSSVPAKSAQPAELSPWDPICAVASELRTAFMDPVRQKVFEALVVLKELSGQQMKLEDDFAVDALAFTLVDLIVRDAGMKESRRDALLQLLAAQVFHASRNSAIRNPKFFWAFLNDLAVKYRGPPTESAPMPRLPAILDRFLAHYGLSGEEDADLIIGLERIVAPLIDQVRGILRGHRAPDGPS